MLGDVTTIDAPSYALKEQRKPEIQALARTIKDIGNEIIKENKLETSLEPLNLAWIINGENSIRDPSFSALQLKAAIDHGSLGESRGIKISFRNINPEKGLQERYETDIAHGLIREFLEKLNVVLPKDKDGWEKIWDKEKNVVIISNPKRPFYAECAVQGITSNGEPKLTGFTVIPKDIELLAAA